MSIDHDFSFESTKFDSIVIPPSTTDGGMGHTFYMLALQTCTPVREALLIFLTNDVLKFLHEKIA